jgi:hypothetical protein
MKTILAKLTTILLLARPVPAPQFQSYSALAHGAAALDGLSTVSLLENPLQREVWGAWITGRRPAPPRVLVTTQLPAWTIDIISRTRWAQRHPRLVRAAYRVAAGESVGCAANNVARNRGSADLRF